MTDRINYSITDPIYGQILVSNQIKKIIDTLVFQRLKRIGQTGSLSHKYPGATHTRFSHSCGVFYLATYFVTNNAYGISMKPNNKLLLQIACLLHDIGHGPLSHFFESITNVLHEEYTKKLIMENKELNLVLRGIYPELPEDLCLVYEKKHQSKFICDLVSSNIDLDRLDYLVRDSYFSGIKYFDIEYHWLISNIAFKDKTLCFDRKIMPALETLLLCRYYLHNSVYNNPATLSYELLIRQLFLRAKHLYKNQPNLNVFIFPEIKQIFDDKTLTCDELMELDDNIFYATLSCFKHCKDVVFDHLYECWRTRRSYLILKDDKANSAKIKAIEQDFATPAERQFYQLRSTVGLVPITSNDLKKQPIYLLNNNKLELIEKKSKIIYGLISNFNPKTEKQKYYFYLGTKHAGK